MFGKQAVGPFLQKIVQLKVGESSSQFQWFTIAKIEL